MTWHPRCGTSFLVVVMIISMFVYAFLPFDNFWAKFVARIALLPVIAGVSYEADPVRRQAARALLALLTRPGFGCSASPRKPLPTTQTAVAIHALERAMALEAKQGGELVIA